MVVHWSGYTSGYQGKRIDNTSVRDEPFVFTIGSNEVCPPGILLEHLEICNRIHSKIQDEPRKD